jgi:hypothetical protein
LTGAQVAVGLGTRGSAACCPDRNDTPSRPHRDCPRCSSGRKGAPSGSHPRRSTGPEQETEIIGHVAEKKASDITLWDSAKRAAKGALGLADGSRSWLDTVHHAAYAARSRNLQQARELLEKAQVNVEAGFFAVLPVSKAFSGIDLGGEVNEFGSDFEALENLRKLAFVEDVDEPQQ